MRVICCHELKDEDYRVIKSAADPDKVLEEYVTSNLQDLQDKVEFIKGNTLKVLYWLIKTGQLTIRIRVLQKGIFHEKYGLIYRPDRNSCFIGGFNLSLSGHLLNSEACAGMDDPAVFSKFENIFLNTWEKAYPFPKAAKHVILKNFEEEWEKRFHTSIEESWDLETGVYKSSIYGTLWEHQQRGFSLFFEKGKHGILQMATGTGKTRLALAIYEELFKSYNVFCCVLVANRSTLLDQWVQDIRKYFPNHSIVRRYGNYNELGDLQIYLDDHFPVFLLTSYSLFSDAEKSVRKVKNKSLIICDEVHNLGADSCERDLKGLIMPFVYRLGLSATPERQYDEEGTTFIQNEIGDIVFEYPLEEALEEGILCKFNYAPIEYSLSEDEKNRINSLVKKKNARNPDGTPVISEQDFARLVSDVIKRSKNKLGPFERFLKQHPDVLERSISFVFDKEYGVEVQKVIQRFNPHFKYHTFYDDDPDDYLDRFSKGGLNCLITCNKISEGISINDISTVILFSASRSKTETLQRIGRCLRTNPENKEKVALIVDFVEKDRVKIEDKTDYNRYMFLTGLCNEVVR